MTFADLQAMKRISDPQVSPSGKWVMFSVTDVSLTKNTKVNHLWVVPINGSKTETQLSSGSGESNGRFSPDGKWVLYTAADADGNSELFQAQWFEDGGTLGAGRRVTALATGAEGGMWAPDSHHFLFVSDVYPDCESSLLPGQARNDQEADCNARKDAFAAKSTVKAQVFDGLLYRHWNRYAGNKRSHIFYGSTDWTEKHMPFAPMDLTPASVIGDHEAPTFSLGGPLGYAISPDGKEVAYVTNLDKVPAESTNNDVFVLPLGAAPSRAKKVSTSPGSDDGPQYSPDGKYLAWRSQARAGFESDKFDLVVMDRSSGKKNILTDHFDGWVDEFAWGPKSDTVLFTSGLRGEEAIFQTSAITGDLAHQIAGIAKEGDFSSLAISPDDQTLVVSGMRVDEPATLLATPLHVPTEQWHKITSLNDERLSNIDFPKMESFSFAGANAHEVQGFLIRPPNFDSHKKYPLKFLIHGGPQGAWGDAWSYRWNPELFAANGYVVVMINPRGSTGYGQQFVDEVSGDWGGRAYFDLMKGLDYVEAKYPFIDKKRECALGGSYGGYMANWILTHTNRFACIVTHDGMYNPQSAFGTTEELWFPEWEFRPLVGEGPDAVVDQTHPAHPWDFYNLPADQDPFRKWSPMLAINNAKTPTLIIHGQLDYRLDVSEDLQLFTALQLRGVPSKLLYFPDEGHWVLKPQNSQLWYRTVNDWVDRWTHTNAYEKN